LIRTPAARSPLNGFWRQTLLKSHPLTGLLTWRMNQTAGSYVGKLPRIPPAARVSCQVLPEGGITGLFSSSIAAGARAAVLPLGSVSVPVMVQTSDLMLFSDETCGL